jgi:hypothetical protein
MATKRTAGEPRRLELLENWLDEALALRQHILPLVVVGRMQILRMRVSVAARFHGAHYSMESDHNQRSAISTALIRFPFIRIFSTVSMSDEMT